MTEKPTDIYAQITRRPGPVWRALIPDRKPKRPWAAGVLWALAYLVGMAACGAVGFLLGMAA